MKNLGRSDDDKVPIALIGFVVLIIILIIVGVFVFKKRNPVFKMPADEGLEESGFKMPPKINY